MRNYINVRYVGENMHTNTGCCTLAVVVCAHLIYGDPSACISHQPNKLQLTSPEVQENVFGKPNVVETYLGEC
jgi:hypothetical protein